MPMSTTLVTMRSPSGSYPSSRFASHTWPMISAADRLRLNPWAPVAQKEQSSAQPIWLEMHSVPRPGSGMKTVSITCSLPAAPGIRSSHLRVPSDAVRAATISGTATVARRDSSARNSLARSVMRAKSASPRRYTHLRSCRARYGLAPKPPTKTSSSVLVIPSRLVRPAVSLMAERISARARAERRFGEEISDLPRRVIGAVGSVHDVFLDAGREVGTHGSGRRFLRVGGTHDVAVTLHGGFAFEHLDHHRPRRHVGAQVAKERPFAVDGIEAFDLALGELQHARGDDPQTRLLEAVVDVADQVTGDAVGLDDGEGTLERHGVLMLRGWPNGPRILAFAGTPRQSRRARKCPSRKGKIRR